MKIKLKKATYKGIIFNSRIIFTYKHTNRNNNLHLYHYVSYMFVMYIVSWFVVMHTMCLVVVVVVVVKSEEETEIDR